ncbi:MAG TPA: hypothetical protein VEW46_09145 [Pyrinomonadaceae bacterium]|nr:hypothetical protein [Pyrinomonadaceae bacterium]
MFRAMVVAFRSAGASRNLLKVVFYKHYVPTGRGNIALRSEATAGEEILEAFIGTETRKHRVDLQIHQPHIALFVSPLLRDTTP